MPLTSKGQEILHHLTEEYGAEHGKEVLYAGKNAGTFTGIDSAFPEVTERMGEVPRVANVGESVLNELPLSSHE